MSAVDVREVRARMIEAADALAAAFAKETGVQCSAAAGGRHGHTRIALIASAYAEGVLRTLAAAILPPDQPTETDNTAQRVGGQRRAATATRDQGGKFLPGESS